MKELFMVPIPSKNALAKHCLEDAKERFRADLKDYEENMKVTLERDAQTGDYRMLSWPIRELDAFLYQKNPYSNTILLPVVLEEMFGKEHLEGGETKTGRLLEKYRGYWDAEENDHRRQLLLAEIIEDLESLL